MNVKNTLREHPALCIVGGAFIAVGGVEVQLLRLGASPFAMLMGVATGLPIYVITVLIGLRVVRGRKRND